MLAKIWKKLLLAICIIAILFNITYKFVSRENLTDQMKSVLHGNVIKFETEDENTTVENNTVIEENSVDKNKDTVKYNNK